MALVPINWRPDRRTLAEFSEFGLFFLGMVATPLALVRGHPILAAVCWGCAVVGRVVGLMRPEALRPVFVGLTLLTWPIGWVVSHLALVLIYGLVFTPMALLFRLIGRDQLNRRLDHAAPSYWEPYHPDRGVARYLRQS